MVLLSFPHNRSLSLYSLLLNWSILHLNQDISTLPLKEEEGEDKNKRAASLRPTLNPVESQFYTVFLKKKNLLLKKQREKTPPKLKHVCKCAGAAALFWFEPLSVSDQYTFKSRLTRGITIPRLIRGRQICFPNYRLKWPVPRRHKLEADRGVIHIYSAEFLH